MENTLKFINEKTKNFKPEIGIILGSGLGDFASKYGEIFIPYSEIPGFESSTVQGHKGQLVFADIQGKRVVMMQGRFHFYEGPPMSTVVFPVKVMKRLGVEKLIITNACGSVNKNYNSGDLMLIKDHINLMGTNPLIGKNDDALGTRFPDMSEIYNVELRNCAKTIASEMNIPIREGVYAAFSGPSYETPAEINMLRLIGADVVGMSTIPEAIVANYCSMNVLGISCISNPAAGVKPDMEKLSHEEVIETTSKVKSTFSDLVYKLIEKI